MEKIIAQGAEAKIILSNNFIIKDRIKKSYRLLELDERIRKLRTRSETKLLEKASKIINVPIPEKSQEPTKIKIPFIKGEKLSENLDNFPLEKQKTICKTIGQEIGKLHDADIIHGDLTTSNMILVNDFKNISIKNNNNKSDKIKLTSKKVSILINKKISANISEQQIKGGWVGTLSNQDKVFFIDFGLGYISKKTEDKAVDLHLLKQALEAKHFKHWETLWKEVEAGYHASKESKKVLERLKAVEKRGRYKDKY